MSYKIELIEKKYPSIRQLEASKSSIKDLFSDFLDETNGFKYQITLKVTLENTSQMEELNFDQFIVIKTVVNHKFTLVKSFQEVLYRIDNWINEGSGLIVELLN